MLNSDVFPDQEIETLFCQLNSVNAVVLAVSGGADSLAMMYLFARWRDKTGWSGKAIVATVDHKLRPEAAEEAVFVAKVSADLGLQHETLVWNDDKPSSNVQAHARDARYKLLRELCKSNSIFHILLAHHADDQAETIISRLIRGSGVTGLGAMRPVSQNNGIYR
ncbi:MAG: tRNA lysidine(34) synthetase TilS [Cohaesibacteraceae bacterium]|nr:tRNA lysidine(34) synthetase TilS [Cohaesibacteraceae bacterium]